MSREEFIKRAIPEITNDYGEVRKTKENSIIFHNGWVASIVPNRGVIVYGSSGESRREYPSHKKYSVAICDYNGYFDWEILNQYGANRGCFYCDTEEEICEALSIIEKLK